MVEPDPRPRPYDDLFDVEQLGDLEKILPGAAGMVLGMIQADMEWQAGRQDRLDRSDHVTRLVSIILTMVVVVTIAGLAAWVIVDGHGAAGSILASADLVALASVLVNSWRRT